jgi:hypothetical protein
MDLQSVPPALNTTLKRLDINYPNIAKFCFVYIEGWNGFRYLSLHTLYAFGAGIAHFSNFGALLDASDAQRATRRNETSAGSKMRKIQRFKVKQTFFM